MNTLKTFLLPAFLLLATTAHAGMFVGSASVSLEWHDPAGKRHQTDGVASYRLYVDLEAEQLRIDEFSLLSLEDYSPAWSYSAPLVELAEKPSEARSYANIPFVSSLGVEHVARWKLHKYPNPSQTKVGHDLSITSISPLIDADLGLPVNTNIELATFLIQVPEPHALALLAVGGWGLGVRRWKHGRPRSPRA
jgi:hypothetical protein